MNAENIDYQTKVIFPTQQLYQQLSSQASELFEQTKESALELHAKVAKSGLQLYEHPTETATLWKEQAIDKSNELYATFNNDIAPVVKADYQQLIGTLADYGLQSQQSFQIFLDNPEKVTVEAFTTLNNALITFFEKSLDVSALMLDTITTKAEEIINLLIQQPIQTMEDIYYQTLSALLNSYFDIISSLISTV